MTKINIYKIVEGYVKQLKIIDKKEHDGIYFLGIKPTSYHVPQMIFSSKYAAADLGVSVFAEIFIDGRCIFRESHSISDNSDLELIKEKTENKLIQSVLWYGIDGAKQILEKYDKNR